MAIIYPELTIESTLDGTWSKKWAKIQDKDLPSHQIDKESNILKCICGEEFDSMDSWSIHVQEKQKEINKGVASYG